MIPRQTTALLDNPTVVPRSRSVQLPALHQKLNCSDRIRRTVDPQFWNAVEKKLPEKMVKRQILPRYLQPREKREARGTGFISLPSSVLSPSARSTMSRVGRPALKTQAVGPGDYKTEVRHDHHVGGKLYHTERFKNLQWKKDELTRLRQLGKHVDEPVGPGDYNVKYDMASSFSRSPRYSFPRQQRFRDNLVEDHGMPRAQTELEYFFKTERDTRIAPSPRFEYQTGVCRNPRLTLDVK